MVTVPFILAMGACASEPDTEETDYTAVCINQETEVRVEDSNCPPDQVNTSSTNMLLWYFILRGTSAPAVGHPVVHGSGSYVRPAGSVGVAPVRGGFGTRSVSVGG